MKNKNIILLMVLALLVLGCEGDGKPQVTERVASQIEISGKVKGGYRHLTFKVSGEPLELIVYRGDYLKFHPDDGGNAQVDYELIIPKMNLSTVIKDDVADQPYFKMKQVGNYEFRLGDRTGIIQVMELKGANYSELSAEDAWSMIKKNPPYILDVRTKPEFNRGYIKNATLIPLQELQQRSNELDMYKNQPILIYCATGNRSTTASKILLDRGFKDVMNLRMGIMGWGSKGYNIQF